MRIQRKLDGSGPPQQPTLLPSPSWLPADSEEPGAPFFVLLTTDGLLPVGWLLPGLLLYVSQMWWVYSCDSIMRLHVTT